MSPLNVKRVAVIGAGPAGAITIDALVQEKAFDTIRVFERREKPGGIWIYDPDQRPRIPSLRDLLYQAADKSVSIPPVLPGRTPKDPNLHSHNNRYSYTPMTDHLESNIDARVMSYTREPFPNQVTAASIQKWGKASPFRHRETVRKWIESLITQRGYEKFIEYSTTVELAEKVGKEWILTLRRSLPGENGDFWWQEKFDALVVANGHYNIPFIPAIPGLEELEDRFPGTVEHSKSYRGTKNYVGKKVIVVGASVSATDIARELISAASLPVYSSIRSPHPLFGTKGFEHPRIDIKPIITSVESSNGYKTVHFSDGSKLHNVDHIIFGTGYVFSLPFLPSVKVVERRLDGFYLHVWRQGDPTLAVVGGTSGGFTFRVFEWQAVAVARVLADRGKLPPLPDQQRWEQERVAERGESVPFYMIGPDYEKYFTALADIAGNPKVGVPGRVLPDWNPRFLEVFLAGLQARMDLWKREKNLAEGYGGASDLTVRARL